MDTPITREVRESDRRAADVALLGWSTLARCRPLAEWEERHGSVVLHASGRPGPELNVVLVLGDQPPERVLDESERFFGAGARYSVIAEHVWLLEKSGAPTKFLVFGSNPDLPLRWLERYGTLVPGLEFYFLADDGRLERLARPR